MKLLPVHFALSFAAAVAATVSRGAGVPITKPESTTTNLAGPGDAEGKRPGARFAAEIVPDIQGAVAGYGRHKVRFPATAGTLAPISLTLPDGQRLRFQFRFLAYRDTASGKQVLVAEAKQSAGEIHPTNQVVYADALTDLSAALRYTCTANALEQDLVLRQCPSRPEEWDLDPATTRVEVWTELFDAPIPNRVVQSLWLRDFDVASGLAGVAAADETLDWGPMKIVAGRAFSLGSGGDAGESRVAKAFVRTQGRQFLVEAVDYLALRPKLDQLPHAALKKSSNRLFAQREAMLQAVADPVAPRFKLRPLEIAQRQGDAGPAVVLDFIIVNCVPLPAGVISWWPAGGNAQDAMAANHNDGTLFNGVAYTCGAVGQTFDFDGYSGYSLVPNAASLNPTTGLTLEGWLLLTDSLYSHQPLVSKDGQLGNRQYLFTVTDENRLRGHVGLTDGVFYYTDSQSVLEPNLWYHVAMTWDGSRLALYVNGVLDTDVAVAGTLLSTTEPVFLGGVPYTSFPYYLWGRLDEMSLYQRALAGSEIASIYDAGQAGKFNPSCTTPPPGLVGWWPGDGNGYDLARTNFGTLKNGATFAPGRVAQAFSFDGVDDQVEVPDAPDLNPASQLTVETWVYQTGNAWENQPLLSKDDPYGTRQYLLTITAGNRFRAHVGLQGYGFLYFDGATTVALNAWYHVALTYDGNRVRLYVNGVLDGQSGVVSGALVTSANPLQLGGALAGGWGNYKFMGLLDEPALYSRALSGTEISALYTAGGAGKCKVDADADGLTDAQEAFLGTDAGKADTDGDGLADGEEVFVWHTDPRQQDTDVDGMPDGWEVAYGLNPLVNDAYLDLDGDGLTNLEEYKLGTDPSHPNVAAPAFNPVGGSYPSTRSVTVTCPTTGVVIHYTLNGQEPTEGSPL